MTEIYTAITVSALALSVIFLVLIILIGLIKAMVYLVPYKEDPSPPEITGSDLRKDHLRNFGRQSEPLDRFSGSIRRTHGGEGFTKGGG